MSGITGGHVILYSRNAAADRAFLRRVVRTAFVDAGGGWLILALPPSEIAVHPARSNGRHEFYLMCDDVDAVTRALARKRIRFTPVRDLGWGKLTNLALPGGGKLGLYEPRHPRPEPAGAPRRARTKKRGA
jgi:hypothetical protein